MYKFLTEKGTMVALLVGVVIIAIYLFTVFSGIDAAGYSAGDDLNKIMKDNPGTDISFFNFGLMATIGLIIIAAAAWLFFGVFQLLSSPKAAVKSLISVGVLAVLFFIMYATSDAESTGRIRELVGIHDISDQTSRLISAGIKTTVSLAVISAVSMVVAEIYNLFK